MQFSSALFNHHQHSHHEQQDKMKDEQLTHALPSLHIEPVIGTAKGTITTSSLSSSTEPSTDGNLKESYLPSPDTVPPPSPIVPTPIVQLGNDIFKEPNEDPREKDVISEIIPAQYSTDTIDVSCVQQRPWGPSSTSGLATPPREYRIKKGGLYLTSFEMLKDPQNILNLPNVRLIVQCAEEYTGILQPSGAGIVHTSTLTSVRNLQVDAGTVNRSSEDISSSSSSTSTSTTPTSSSASSVPSIVVPLSIEILELRMEDMVHFKLDTIVASTLPRIANVRTNGGSVIINCAAGRSRSATMVLFTLINPLDQGGEQMSLIDAIHHLRSIRPRACPNLGFISSLMNYETALYGQCSIPVSTLRYHFDAKQLFDTVKEAEEYGQAAIDRGKEVYGKRQLETMVITKGKEY